MNGMTVPGKGGKFEMKKMKRIVSMVLALLLAVAAAFSWPVLTKANDVPSAADVYINGTINVIDELGNWWQNNAPAKINDGPGDFFVYVSPDNSMYDADVQESMQYGATRGFSYDHKTNTLTISNVSLDSVIGGKTYKNYSYGLDIQDMKNLKLNVVGKNELTFIHVNNTNLTITGSGSLTLNPPLSWRDGDEDVLDQHIGLFIPISADEATVSIDKDVEVTIIPDNDEYWDTLPEYSWGIMSFSFQSKPASDDFFSSATAPSEPLQWKTLGGQYVEQYVDDYDNTVHIYHKFPAGRICKLEGYTGENNYWIRSAVDNEQNRYYYAKLNRNAAGWFEDFSEAYYCDFGTWKPVVMVDAETSLSYIDYQHPLEEPLVFTPYDDFSEMPSDLYVGEGMAEAYVRMGANPYASVYTKNGHEYRLLLAYYPTEYNGYYYNTNLQAVDPVAPEVSSYSYVMLLINEKQGFRYLTYGEELCSTFDVDECSEWRNNEEKVATDRGYEKKRVDASYVSAYQYYVVNRDGVSFIPERQVDISKCTISGVTEKTYNGKAQTQNITVKYEGKTLIKDTDYSVAYSNNTNAGTAKLTVTGKGTYTGSQTLSFKIKAKQVTPKITFSKASFTYNGKIQKPTVTVKAGSEKLKVKTDYTIKWPKGCKNVGTYKVTVELKGNYSGKGSKSFTINPKGTTLSKLTSASKAFTAKWKKQATQTTGYQIRYSTSKSFKSAKTVTVTNNKTTSQKIKKLKGKTTYYVQIRTYKTVGKKKYYSDWSKTKTVKTK